MAVGTCKTAALGKGQGLAKSTSCPRFRAEVGGGSPLLPPGNSWRHWSLSRAQWPFLTLKVNFADKARPGPAPTGGLEGEGTGQRQPPVRAAGAGTERAIDMQGPKWNPVRRGQKGREKREGAVLDTPLRGACRGAWVFRGRGPACQAAPGSPEVAQSPAPLGVLMGGTQPLFQSVLERYLAGLLFLWDGRRKTGIIFPTKPCTAGSACGREGPWVKCWEIWFYLEKL